MKSFDSIKLCEIIVCNRYLNIAEKEASEAMEELAERRKNGDDFNFEEHIDNSLKDLPDISFSMKDFNSIINKAKKI